MKIGLLIPYLREKAGGEHETLYVAKGLQDLGHDVKIYTYAANPDKCFPELFAKVRVVSATRDSSLHEKIHSNKKFFMKYFAILRPYYEFFMMLRLGKIVDADREVLLATNTPAQWAAHTASSRLKIPWSWLCNEPPFYFDPRIPKGVLTTLLQWPIYNIWDRYCVKSVSAVFALSRVFKPYIDNLYGVDAIVAHLPYMPGSKFMPSPARTPGKAHALYVASLSSYKRPMDAIDAMSYAPSSELTLVGEGYLRPKLEAQIRALGLEGRVRLAGRVSDEELANLYAKSSVMIVTAEQSWGLVAVDAMDRGVVVISSPDCGVSEIIDDGKTGFIVPNRNPKAIAEKINFVASHPAEAEKIAAEAKKVVKTLTLERYAKQIEDGLKASLKKIHKK